MNIQKMYLKDFKTKKLELFKRHSQHKEIAKNKLISYLTFKVRKGNTLNCMKMATAYMDYLKTKGII